MAILLTLFLVACGAPKKSQIIGVKSGGEYFAVDHDAKEAIANNNTKERLVCKRHQVTGTHFKSKRCTTASAQKRERDRSEMGIEKNRGLINKILTESKKGY